MIDQNQLFAALIAGGGLGFVAGLLRGGLNGVLLSVTAGFLGALMGILLLPSLGPMVGIDDPYYQLIAHAVVCAAGGIFILKMTDI
jgi:uncharacterized membrane protein YeaQ/YmgE (transglycosylase-associated protein family)